MKSLRYYLGWEESLMTPGGYHSTMQIIVEMLLHSVFDRTVLNSNRIKTDGLKIYLQFLFYHALSHFTQPPILYINLHFLMMETLWIVSGFSNVIVDDYDLGGYSINGLWGKNMNKCLVSVSCWHKVFCHDCQQQKQASHFCNKWISTRCQCFLAEIYNWG